MRLTAVFCRMTASLYGRAAWRSRAWCFSSSRWRSAAKAAAFLRSFWKYETSLSTPRCAAAGLSAYSSTTVGGWSCFRKRTSKHERAGGRAWSSSCDMAPAPTESHDDWRPLLDRRACTQSERRPRADDWRPWEEMLAPSP